MTIGKKVRNLRRTLCLCAWCGREKKGNGAWDRSRVDGKKELFAAVTHGICPDCARRLLGGRTRNKAAKRVG